jgi:putative ABC transport system substrate-binding protein
VRRLAVALLALTLLAVPLAAEAQPAKIPRIGYLSQSSGPSVLDEAFSKSLSDLGYIEGQNIAIERRFAGTRLDRLPKLARDLVRLKVDVIVALDPLSVNAARKATRTVPIVMWTSVDPVEVGLVASLAHPGGNITGLYSIAEALTGKRLELVTETMPTISRIAILWDPGSRGSRRWLSQAVVAARSLGVQLQALAVRRPDDFEAALEAATDGSAGALLTLRGPLLVTHRRRIAELAAAYRLPAISDDPEFVEAGNLMAYGPSLSDSYRRVATYMDKILKGAKPADLPVEQPTTFELVINLKTAKALGLTIPPSVLARADEVIE